MLFLFLSYWCFIYSICTSYLVVPDLFDVRIKNVNPFLRHVLHHDLKNLRLCKYNFSQHFKEELLIILQNVLEYHDEFLLIHFLLK